MPYRFRCLLMAACLLPCAAVAENPATEPQPDPAQLRETILALDARLFDAVFVTCDTQALAELVGDDLEFYHDRSGLTARSGKEFIDGVARNCAGRDQPGSYRSRRELVAASLQVYPVPGFGAMQLGSHRFHERQDDGPETHVGSADFAMVWRHAQGRWQLTRVLSYAHR